MRLATLNLRNTADRWAARRRLLVGQLVDLAPDVLGVQELRMVPDQARWIASQVSRCSDGAVQYRVYRRGKAGVAGVWEGIGVLSRLPVVATAWLDLGGQGRVAQRVTVRVGAGRLLDVYNTHLARAGEERRLDQAGRILDWIERRPPAPAVLLGDLNARPGSPTVELLSGRLRSAHAIVHGAEPARTVPTPLRRGPAGAGAVLDYVFVNELVEVHDARVVFDGLDPGDPTLAPSDHYGLVADITTSCSPASPGRRRR